MAGGHGWILSRLSCGKDMSDLLFYVLLRLVHEIEFVVRVGIGRPILGSSAICMGAMVCPGDGRGHGRRTEGMAFRKKRAGLG